MASFHEVDGVASVESGRRPRLLEQVRARIRRLGMARRTEEAYVGWIRRFILANDKRHPSDMGAPEIERFLTRLAVDGSVSASTQNQALGPCWVGPSQRVLRQSLRQCSVLHTLVAAFAALRQAPRIQSC